MNDLLSVAELDTQEISEIFEFAEFFSKKPKDLFLSYLQGKVIPHLFFEDSTRTRVSFEIATARLGGQPVLFSGQGTSLSKGETFSDTIRVVAAMDPACLVIRHASEGASKKAAEVLKKWGLPISVVNAGDGRHEHPTQALLDAYTMKQKFSDLKGKQVLIVGDILHSRVARSNTLLLQKLGVKVMLCGPKALIPRESVFPGARVSDRLEDFIGDADVVMSIRIQKERQNRSLIPSLGEYFQKWGITGDRFKQMKKDAWIMDPGPMVRGVQIADEVADSDRSLIFDQVRNGVLVRMAVLSWILAREQVRVDMRKEGFSSE